MSVFIRQEKSRVDEVREYKYFLTSSLFFYRIPLCEVVIWFPQAPVTGEIGFDYL